MKRQEKQLLLFGGAILLFFLFKGMGSAPAPPPPKTTGPVNPPVNDTPASSTSNILPGKPDVRANDSIGRHMQL